MRRTTPLALAAAALLLAGCGAQSGTTGGSGSGSGTDDSGKASPTPSASSASSASSVSPSGGCVAHAELTAADNGRTLCLTRGGDLRLTLDGTRSRPWKPVMTSGTALEAINPGFVILPGDATAAYRAVQPGTAKLTSSRPLCPQPTAPGQVACQGIQEWTATVTVR
ncbi:hypothetical protein ACGFYV_24095 [Streptomyces sp. NPDC048297]|uniref:hypothetical protein n=1 Tax=Streptomyces sp. NPDC048297 TaxID=3365531 RepID=UPI00371273C5